MVVDCFLKNLISWLPRRNTNTGHLVFSRQNQVQFRSKNFSTIVTDYLPREEDIQSIVAEIDAKLSNNKIPSDLSSSSVYNRAGMFLPNPNDSARALQVDGAILPQNKTVLLLSFVIDEIKD